MKFVFYLFIWTAYCLTTFLFASSHSVDAALAMTAINTVIGIPIGMYLGIQVVADDLSDKLTESGGFDKK